MLRLLHPNLFQIHLHFLLLLKEAQAYLLQCQEILLRELCHHRRLLFLRESQSLGLCLHLQKRIRQTQSRLQVLLQQVRPFPESLHLRGLFPALLQDCHRQAHRVFCKLRAHHLTGRTFRMSRRAFCFLQSLRDSGSKISEGILLPLNSCLSDCNAFHRRGKIQWRQDLLHGFF